MRNTLLMAMAIAGLAGCTSPNIGSPGPAATETWDMARVGRTIDAARLARGQGDPAGAERLCREAFESVERSTLAAYDAFADLLKAEHRAEEPTVRAQSARLHELEASRARAVQPTSDYLGFAPSDGLNSYADLLQKLQRPEAAQRMRSLALAYRQVQEAHFQRIQLFRRGADPRGAC